MVEYPLKCTVLSTNLKSATGSNLKSAIRIFTIQEGEKTMTLMQWLFTEHGYDEAVMIDANGNECEFWTDDDEKMQAHVLRVEDRDMYGCTANVYTDYRA